MGDAEEDSPDYLVGDILQLNRMQKEAGIITPEEFEAIRQK